MRDDGERPPPDLPAALAIAERFLAVRPRTRQELTRRLLRAGTEEGVIDAAMTTLERLGYVDDEAFARNWVEQRDRHAPRGRALLSAELRRLGVAPETTHDAIAGLGGPDAGAGAEPGRTAGEHERAMAAAQKHLRGRRLDGSDAAAVRRLLAFLQRRGFGYGTAMDVVRRQAGTDPEESDEGDD